MSRRRRVETPELSGVVRVALAAAMAIALAALALTADMPVACAVSAAGIALGYTYSWRQRPKPRSKLGQAVIAVALMLLVGYLLSDLFDSAFGGDLPQAHFVIFVAAVTSFDVKTRRNSYSHFWHSLVVLYVAGLFAWSGLFMVVVVAWGAAFVTAVAAMRQRGSRPQRRLRTVGASSRLLLAWFAVSVAMFIALPEFAGRPIAVPLLVGVPISSNAGEALPPTLPLVGSSTAAAGGIDLRARGRFGDEIALHVRSASPSYWRAYSLENYSGTEWSRDTGPPVSDSAIAGDDIHPDGEVAGAGAGTLSQSFVVETDLPGDIIGAYPMQSVDVSTGSMQVFPDGAVTLNEGLAPGTSYGVVSQVRDTSPQTLRADGPYSDVATFVPSGDTALPPTVTQRTRDLAHTLVAPTRTEYDAVIAVVNYLTSHDSYSLDVPRVSESDAVDQFLFVDHLGFCEQFSSALAVMLRSQGIPARIAVGYATGDYDRLTSSYTVHNSDAHAWTEVLFPGVGWVPFDASPGFNATPETPAPGHSLFNLDLALSIGGMNGGAAIVGTVAGSIALVVALVVGGRRFARRRRMDPLLRRYGDAQRRLRRRGLASRMPSETIAAHLERLAAENRAAAASLAPLAADVERALYAQAPSGH